MTSCSPAKGREPHLEQSLKPPQAPDISQAAKMGLKVVSVARQHQAVAQCPHIGGPHILLMPDRSVLACCLVAHNSHLVPRQVGFLQREPCSLSTEGHAFPAVSPKSTLHHAAQHSSICTHRLGLQVARDDCQNDSLDRFSKALCRSRCSIHEMHAAARHCMVELLCV